MNFSSAGLIYFSPTGTTRKIAGHIARGIGARDVIDLDLTMGSPENLPKGPEDMSIAIIGAPVYAGRVALTAVQRLEKISVKGIPAVVVVLYGNRAYDDALVELIDLSRACGFQPIAAGAFIGEHSYATDTYPVAAGRPDQADLAAAEDFGTRLGAKYADSDTLPPDVALSVPGNRPFKERTAPLGQSPITQADLCTLCGTCATVCPTHIIAVNDTVTTDEKRCIACCACIKNCPTGARIFTAERPNKAAKFLWTEHRERKTPEVFY